MGKERRVKSLDDLGALFPGSVGAASGGGAEHAPRSEGKGRVVHVRLETGGRKGKTVTVVTGLQHDPGTMARLASGLKQHCGAGGTVKDGTIEIQGDQRERVVAYLKGLGYDAR
jgi:translation initiation factor 1